MDGQANGSNNNDNNNIPQPNLPTSNHTPAVPRTTKGKYSLVDFTLKRTLGTGSFGRVHLVQSNHNQRFYAVKVLKKAQVVKMKQVEHTNDERKMLTKVKHPFLFTLWGTSQDSNKPSTVQSSSASPPFQSCQSTVLPADRNFSKDKVNISQTNQSNSSTRPL